MTPTQTELVQSTFDHILPIADDAAALFYARLFHIDPSLRVLFPRDMKQQGKKLMDMLSVGVRNLDRLDVIEPALRGLGQRHVAYGVREEHYDTVGRALLWTLEQGLGSKWSEAVHEAWSAAYARLAAPMKLAAAQVELVAC